MEKVNTFQMEKVNTFQTEKVDDGCSLRAHVISCFTHNGRTPQPLYAEGDVLRHAQAPPACLGMQSDMSGWLLPLQPTATTASRPAIASGCVKLLHEPAALLRAAEAGFGRLLMASGGRERRTRSMDAEAIAWYWHSLAVVQRAQFFGRSEPRSQVANHH